MKKLILSIVAIVTIAISSFGQAPEGFKYQAVVRDAGNIILNNQAVGMRMTIQQGSIGGTTVYQEIFVPTTNGYGLVNLEIGSGTVVSGDFTTIDWSVGPYFIETAVDLTGGTSYAVMGTSQLMSVPYALHAKTAENVINDAVDDADNDPTNEIETWSTLSGIPADIADGDDVDDADADPNNEIQTLSVSGNTLTLSNSGGTVAIPAPVVNDIGGRSGICSGRTFAGTDWSAYDPTTLSITVNTSGCGYSATPKYFTSMGGIGSHFELVGFSAIYSPTATGFTVYLQKNDGTTLSLTDAVSGGWYINWQGIGD